MRIHRGFLAGCVLALGIAACTGGGGTSGGSIVPINNTIASVTVTGVSSVTAGTPTSIPLTVTAMNSSGVVITGTYKVAITLSDSDATGATTVSPATITSSTTTVTLTYNGSGGFKGATITAAATGATSGTLAVSNLPTCNTIATISGYYPCDLQQAYSLPVSLGTGQSIAVVDAYDDPNAEADLGVYRAEFGLPVCTTANGCFKKVNQSGVQGSYPAANTGWAGEESLDLDMVSAVCPNCHIILVEATSNSGSDLATSENTAATLGATEISNSYGGLEYAGETTTDAAYNHAGIVITVSAGDNGYQEGTNYPAASPYVTAVGGTSLVTAANARGWTETVWSNSNTQGTGSGCSAYEPKPAWQTDTGCTKRMEADLSAVADPTTGVAYYDTYNSSGWGVVGGTSASSPIVAGMYALAGNAATVNYGSYPYLHPGFLNDITSGSNGTCTPAYFCTAEVGYDGPTGLGTPDGTGGLGSLNVMRPAKRRTILMVPKGAQMHRLCSAPAPGDVACFAIRVVGVR